MKNKKKSFLAVVMALAMLISAVAAVPVLACDGDSCDAVAHGHVRRGQGHNHVELDYGQLHTAYDSEALQVYLDLGYTIAIVLADGQATPYVVDPSGVHIEIDNEKLPAVLVEFAWNAFSRMTSSEHFAEALTQDSSRHVAFGIMMPFIGGCCMSTHTTWTLLGATHWRHLLFREIGGPSVYCDVVAHTWLRIVHIACRPYLILLSDIHQDAERHSHWMCW